MERPYTPARTPPQMPDSLRLSTFLPATPRRVYQAWLSSRAHTAFTGAEA